MDNPYQAPQWTNNPFQDQPPPVAGPVQSPGMVNQVRIVAILMMIQGGLDLVMGLFYIVIGFILPSLMKADMQNNPAFRPGGGGDPQAMLWIMTAVYMGMGGPAIVGGILRIWAGIRNYQFHSRTFGIVALIMGIGSVATCYCAPTTIALAVYGLIVYFNREVAQAFEMRKQGYTTQQVLEAFSPYSRPAPAGSPPPYKG